MDQVALSNANGPPVDECLVVVIIVLIFFLAHTLFLMILFFFLLVLIMLDVTVEAIAAVIVRCAAITSLAVFGTGAEGQEQGERKQ
tara:strand:- start:908 stop:1165 length:258 start_codon:yes stop_codon:yes gene_type:complete